MASEHDRHKTQNGDTDQHREDGFFCLPHIRYIQKSGPFQPEIASVLPDWQAPAPAMLALLVCHRL